MEVEDEITKRKYIIERVLEKKSQEKTVTFKGKVEYKETEKK